MGSVRDDSNTFLYKGTLQFCELSLILNLVVVNWQLHTKHNHIANGYSYF